MSDICHPSQTFLSGSRFRLLIVTMSMHMLIGGLVGWWLGWWLSVFSSFELTSVTHGDRQHMVTDRSTLTDDATMEKRATPNHGV